MQPAQSYTLAEMYHIASGASNPVVVANALAQAIRAFYNAADTGYKYAAIALFNQLQGVLQADDWSFNSSATMSAFTILRERTQ